MHKIWQGTDPHLVMTGLAFFLGALALFIHLWAYSITGWPKDVKASYAAKAAAAQPR